MFHHLFRGFPLHMSSSTVWKGSYRKYSSWLDSLRAKSLHQYQHRLQRSFNNYRIPPQNSVNVVYAIMAINGAVYLYWQQAMNNYKDFNFMRKHFLMSSDGVLKHGKVYTILTSMFSHQQFFHLFSNMFTLYFFGVEAAMILGARAFLGLYFAGGIAGGISYAIWPWISYQYARYTGRPLSSRYHLRQTPGLGASGAVSAVILWSICSYPLRTIYLYGLLPVPAAVFGIGFIAMDVMDMYSGNATGGPAHVGGALIGMSYYLARRFIGRGRF
jgi:membrane associated rhomboid family serine protease